MQHINFRIKLILRKIYFNCHLNITKNAGLKVQRKLLHRPRSLMETDARLFNCARCFKQVVICSGCDRGNIYCTKSCATLSRKRSLKTAGNKSQQTKAGKIKHAARQQSYRQKQKKVTHHSSLIPTTNDLLITERSFDLINTSTTSTKQIQCHFCGKFCSVYVRTGFKRDHLRVIQIQNDQKLSQGP